MPVISSACERPGQRAAAGRGRGGDAGHAPRALRSPGRQLHGSRRGRGLRPCRCPGVDAHCRASARNDADSPHGSAVVPHRPRRGAEHPGAHEGAAAAGPRRARARTSLVRSGGARGAQEILRRISGRCSPTSASRIEALEQVAMPGLSGSQGAQRTPTASASYGRRRRRSPQKYRSPWSSRSSWAPPSPCSPCRHRPSWTRSIRHPLPPNPPPVTLRAAQLPVPIPTAGPSGLATQYVGMPCYIYDEFGVRRRPR